MKRECENALHTLLHELKIVPHRNDNADLVFDGGVPRWGCALRKKIDLFGREPRTQNVAADLRSVCIGLLYIVQSDR